MLRCGFCKFFYFYAHSCPEGADERRPRFLFRGTAAHRHRSYRSKRSWLKEGNKAQRNEQCRNGNACAGKELAERMAPELNGRIEDRD